MNGTADTFMIHSPESWRRFACTVPLSVVTLAVLLLSSSLIKPNLPAPPQFNAVEVHLIEPPARPAGLQGGAAPARAAQPKREPARKPAPAVHHRTVKAEPSPAPTAAENAPSSSVGGSSSSAAVGPAGGTPEGGVPGGTGIGGGAGVGNDSAGARAIYAPLPKIPDELREYDFKSVAVARFKVSPGGTVTVALITPTPDPRLNEILLATLRQWRFFPAMRDGEAVASEFDVRIPIVVQ
jgi:periplasmic protein TonB